MFSTQARSFSAKKRQFHIGLDPPVTTQPLDWRGEVHRQHGGSADLLRRGIGKHGSCAARAVAVDGMDDGKNDRADVVEVVIKVVNEGIGCSFLASLDSFLTLGS